MMAVVYFVFFFSWKVGSGHCIAIAVCHLPVLTLSCMHGTSNVTYTPSSRKLLVHSQPRHCQRRRPPFPIGA
jgi:hypothetical protein